MLTITAETGDRQSRWAGLFRSGGVAAGVIAVLLVGEVVVYSLLPRPDTVAEHLELFHDDVLTGLLTLDLLGLVAYLLFIPVMLALYQALHRVSEAIMAIATVLFLVGIAEFLATDPPFTVMTLSQQYDAATTAADRARILAAGEAMIAQFDENAFLVSYVIVSAAWLGVGAVMLRSDVFGRRTAVTGVVAGASGILAVVLEHIPAGPVLLGIAIAFYFVALVALLVWVVLLVRPLHRLGAAAGGAR